MDLTDFTKQFHVMQVAQWWHESKENAMADKGTAKYYAQAAAGLIRKLNRGIPEAKENTTEDKEAMWATMIPKSARGVPRKERKRRTKLDEYAR